MPFSGEVKDGVYRSKFDKKSEKASPGYYSVRLTDAAVDVELTSTQRTAFHRYVYHSAAPARLLVDLQNGIVWDKERLKTHVLSAEMDMPDNHTITGHQVVENWVKRQYYYVLSFDKPYVVREVLPSAGGEKAKRLILDFDLAEGDTLQVKIALSSVCLEGAKAALAKENPGWDFDKIRMEARRQWNNLFDRVKVTGSDEQKKNFYTSLYHLFIQPNDMADTDGRYRGADDKVYTVKDGLLLFHAFPLGHLSCSSSLVHHSLPGAGGRNDTEYARTLSHDGVSSYLGIVGKRGTLHDRQSCYPCHRGRLSERIPRI